MTTKHTPSPWVVSGGIVKTSDGLYNVCDCLISYSLTTSEMEANARLIASAPELLEALEEIILWEPRQKADRERAAYRLAKAAIAKATGEDAP